MDTLDWGFSGSAAVPSSVVPPVLRKGLILLGDSITAANSSTASVASAVGDGTYLEFTTTGTHTFKPLSGVSIYGFEEAICGDYFVVDAKSTTLRVLSSFVGNGTPQYASTPGARVIGAAGAGYYTYAAAAAATGYPLLRDSGVSGSRLTDMRARLPWDVLRYKPEYVHLMGGTNDISASRSVADMMADVTAIVDALAAIGSKVIIGSVIPTTATRGAALSEKTQAFNTALRSFCLARNIRYLDYWSLLAVPGGYGDPQYYADTIHPNTLGHMLMGRLLVDVLRDISPVKIKTLPTLATDGGFVPDPLFQNTKLRTGVTNSGTTPAMATVSSSGTTTTVSEVVPADSVLDGDTIGNRFVTKCTMPDSGTYVLILPQATANYTATADCGLVLEGMLSVTSDKRCTMTISAVPHFADTGLSIYGCALSITVGPGVPSCERLYFKSRPFPMQAEKKLDTYQIQINVTSVEAGANPVVRLGRLAYRAVPKCDLVPHFPGDEY